MKKLLFTILLFLGFVLPASASNWVSTPAQCPANNFTAYPAQDCTPLKMCGVVSGTVQCNANSFSAPAATQTVTTAPVTSTSGFIIDCETTSGGSVPYCNNGTTGFCNASSTFYTTQHRSTVCSANLFASSTAGACLAAYLDCSGDVACETQIGVTAFTQPQTTYLTCSTGQCSSGYQACNGDTPTANGCLYQTGVTTCTTGDGSPGTYGASCTCVAIPQTDIFTNTFASNFGSWWLWGNQTNPTGGLINISNSTTHAGITADSLANVSISSTLSIATTTSRGNLTVQATSTLGTAGAFFNSAWQNIVSFASTTVSAFSDNYGKALQTITGVSGVTVGQNDNPGVIVVKGNGGILFTDTNGDLKNSLAGGSLTLVGGSATTTYAQDQILFGMTNSNLNGTFNVLLNGATSISSTLTVFGKSNLIDADVAGALTFVSATGTSVLAVTSTITTLNANTINVNNATFTNSAAMNGGATFGNTVAFNNEADFNSVLYAGGLIYMANYTGYPYANGASNLTFSTTIPNTDITGLSTMSTQAANNVTISGGSINGTTVGASTPASGSFTTLKSSGAITMDTSGNLNLAGILKVATSTINPNGLFFADASGNVSASGSLRVFGSTQGTEIMATNDIMVMSGGTTTSTLFSNGLYIATSTSHNQGLFFVDASGDVSASGSLKIFGASSLASPLTVTGTGSTSTLFNNAFYVNTSTANPMGKFFIDSSGNMSVTGTLRVFANASFGTTTFGTTTQQNSARVSITDGGLEINTPSTTAFGASTSTEAYAALDIKGKIAIVISGTQIKAYDISNPAFPTILSSISGFDSSYGGNRMCFDGKYAFVSSQGTKTLGAIDFSNPAVPVSTTFINSGSIGEGVICDGTRIFDVRNSGGLDMFSYQNPTLKAPVLLSNFSTSTIRDIQIQGQLAFTAESSTMSIYNVSSTVISKMGQVAINIGINQTAQVAPSGKYVYVAAHNAGFVVVDISNPSAPVIVTSTTNVTPASIAVSGRYAYLGNGSTLSVYDISSTTLMYQVDSFAVGGTINNIIVQGDYVWMATSAGLKVERLFDGIDTPNGNIDNLTMHFGTVQGSFLIGESLTVGNALTVGMGGINNYGLLNVQQTSTFWNDIIVTSTNKAIDVVFPTGCVKFIFNQFGPNAITTSSITCANLGI